eukprot:72557-Rhodomonas_salina.1
MPCTSCPAPHASRMRFHGSDPTLPRVLQPLKLALDISSQHRGKRVRTALLALRRVHHHKPLQRRHHEAVVVVQGAALPDDHLPVDQDRHEAVTWLVLIIADLEGECCGWRGLGCCGTRRGATGPPQSSWPPWLVQWISRSRPDGVAHAG